MRFLPALFLVFLMPFALAENVWTLGAREKLSGWPLVSPDGSVRIYVKGGKGDDLSSGAITLLSVGKATDADGGPRSIDLRGLAIDNNVARIRVKSVEIGADFLRGDKTVSRFYADNVTSMGRCAFSRAAALESVSLRGTARELPDGGYPGHPTIRSGVFSDCHALKDLVLDLPLESVGSAAFAGATNLTVDVSRLVPQGITNIGAFAFCHCGRVRGELVTESVQSVGARAFLGAGFDSIRLGCADSFKSFPYGGSSGGTAYGVFTLCPNLTNLEIRAVGLVSLGNLNFADLPSLKRFSVDAPKLESLGGSRGSCTSLPALELIEMNTAVLREVGASWTAFNRTRSLKEVIWRGPPPSLGAFKRIFQGVSPVANTAQMPKRCIIRAKDSSGEWDALASPFEGEEAKLAPEGCAGVMFASSRKAWLIVEK